MDETLSVPDRDDISIVLCGQAGMGIQTVEVFLTRILKLAGYNVFAAKEYMSRVRGGSNSTEIRVSSRPVRAFVSRIDILIPLNKGAVQHVKKRISPETIVLAEEEIVQEDLKGNHCKFINVPFTKMAVEIGNVMYSNVIAAGVIAGLFGMELRTVIDYIERHFSAKSADIVQNNIKAASAGFKVGTDLAGSVGFRFGVVGDAKVGSEILLNGGEAVAAGAIAGGCNFIAAYPMSPSTPVLVFLAQNAGNFGIIAEQAEDEIAAMNMAIGAGMPAPGRLSQLQEGGLP